MADDPMDMESLKGLTRIANQVSGPSSCGNPIRRSTWSQMSGEMFGLVTADNEKISKISTAIIYLCLMDQEIQSSVLMDSNFLTRMLNLLLEQLRGSSPSEWSLYTVQRLLGSKIPSLEETMDKIHIQNRLYLMDIIIEMITEATDKNEDLLESIAEPNLTALGNGLKAQLIRIERNASSNWTTEECQFIMKWISVISEVSANEKNRFAFLDEESFYTQIIDTLKKVHMIHKAKGLQSGNLEVDDETKPENAIAAVKKYLVRLMATLSHKRPHLKLLASKIDAVPLILDLHSYDKNNPFIREWAILAIRNLLEDCEENRSIVRQLKDHNIIADPTLADQLGLKFVNNRVTVINTKTGDPSQ